MPHPRHSEAAPELHLRRDHPHPHHVPHLCQGRAPRAPGGGSGGGGRRGRRGAGSGRRIVEEQTTPRRDQRILQAGESGEGVGAAVGPTRPDRSTDRPVTPTGRGGGVDGHACWRDHGNIASTHWGTTMGRRAANAVERQGWRGKGQGEGISRDARRRVSKAREDPKGRGADVKTGVRSESQRSAARWGAFVHQGGGGGRRAPAVRTRGIP